MDRGFSPENSPQSGQRVESKEARSPAGGPGTDGLRGPVEGAGRLRGAADALCLVQPGLHRLEVW